MPLLPANEPATEQEIDAFLTAFVGCTLPKEEFTHAAHLLTGACFTHCFGEAAAIEHMRRLISRFNESVGGQNTDSAGYHETITVFWIKMLAALRATPPHLPRGAFAALAIERFGNRREAFRDFYDFDVVASTEARRSWMEPTLKPITAANL